MSPSQHENPGRSTTNLDTCGVREPSFAPTLTPPVSGASDPKQTFRNSAQLKSSGLTEMGAEPNFCCQQLGTLRPMVTS